MARSWQLAQQRELSFWRSIYENRQPDIPTYSPITEQNALYFTAKTLARFEVPISDLSGRRLVDLGSGPYGIVKGLCAFPGLRQIWAIDPLIGLYKQFHTFPEDERLVLVQGKGEHLPFESRSLDWIFLINVLDHVENPEKVIAECARVLRPDGAVCVAVHAIYNGWNHVRPILRYVDANHPHHFNEATAQRLCEQCFRTVRVTCRVPIVQDHPDFSLKNALFGPGLLRGVKRLSSRLLLKLVYFRCGDPG
jgi:SAM-dependent methyltransferase